jgi:hypothetical protein
MDAFWKSLQFSASLSGCVFAPFMALAFIPAHLSFTSKIAKTASTVALVMALPVLVLSILGIVASIRSSPFFPVASNAPLSRLAVTSIALSSSGFCTLGLGSLVGCIIGILALWRICRRREQRGQILAVLGISLSCGVMGLLWGAMAFLGP